MADDKAVSLKVKYPDGASKAFRLSPEKFVADLIEEVRSKMKDESLGQELVGLFQPGTKGRSARWLLPNRTLKFYGITSSGVRYMPIRIYPLANPVVPVLAFRRLDILYLSWIAYHLIFIYALISLGGAGVQKEAQDHQNSAHGRIYQICFD
jgi:hypothetical protein